MTRCHFEDSPDEEKAKVMATHYRNSLTGNSKIPTIDFLTEGLAAAYKQGVIDALKESKQQCVNK